MSVVRDAPEAAAKRTSSPQLKASVIVLGYNGRQYLEDCLSSLLAQDIGGTAFEVLYVDNGSADNSVEFVRERFGDVTVLALPRNLGFAEGNNVGFRETRGEFVVFLNQDTVVHRRWLQELLKAAESAPDVGACHANQVMPWQPEFGRRELAGRVEALQVADFSKFGFVNYRLRPYSEQPLETLFLAGSAVLIRRDLIEDGGYVFEPRFFAYCEDSDLALRVAGQGKRNLLAPASVYYHKHSLATSFSVGTLGKTTLILRNRFLCFFRNMNLLEFALYAPLIAVGAPLKAGEFNLAGWKRVAYGLAMIPLTVVGFARAVASMPSWNAERRRILARRQHGRFWLLREMLKR